MHSSHSSNHPLANQCLKTYSNFNILIISQFISVLGSQLSRFAFPIWLFSQFGTATSISFATLFSFLPRVLLGPFSGALVDALPKKPLIIITDTAQAIITLIFCVIVWQSSSGTIPLALIFFLLFLNGVFSETQFPAIHTLTTMLADKSQLTRANGRLSLIESTSNFIAPLIAGALIYQIKFEGILAIDFVSFLVGMSFFLFLKVPDDIAVSRRKMSLAEFFKSTKVGFSYIFHNQGLFFLLGHSSLVNFCFSLTIVLFAPMVLLFTQNNAILLGTLSSAGGFSQILGSSAVSFLPEIKRRSLAIGGGTIICGLLGIFLLGVYPNPVFWGVGLCVIMFVLPIMNSYGRAPWQEMVPIHQQGVVHGTRRSISSLFGPLGFALAGPLVDKVFSPMFPTVSGAGYQINFIIFGLLMAFLGVFALIFKPLREIDR